MAEQKTFIGKREKARIARQRKQRAIAGGFLSVCICISLMSMGVHYSRVNTAGMLTTEQIVVEQVDAGKLQENHYPVYAVTDDTDSEDTKTVTDEGTAALLQLPDGDPTAAQTETAGTGTTAAVTGGTSVTTGSTGTAAKKTTTGSTGSTGSGTAAKKTATGSTGTAAKKAATGSTGSDTAAKGGTTVVTPAKPVETTPAETTPAAAEKSETVVTPALVWASIHCAQTDVTIGDTVQLTVIAENSWGEDIADQAAVLLHVSGGTAEGRAVTFTEAGTAVITAEVTVNGVTLTTMPLTINVKEAQVPASVSLTLDRSEAAVGDTAAATVTVLDQDGSPVEGCTVSLEGTGFTADGTEVTFTGAGTAEITAKVCSGDVELKSEAVNVTVTDPVTLPDGTVINAAELGEEQTVCGLGISFPTVMTLNDELNTASLDALDMTVGVTSSDRASGNAEEALEQRLAELGEAEELDTFVNTEENSYYISWVQDGTCHAELHRMTGDGEMTLSASWSAEYRQEGAKLLHYTAASVHTVSETAE